MLLTNADGSSAEMSGNGIRCLVQAAVAARMASPGTVVVDTGAGRRQVEYSDLGAGLGFGRGRHGPGAWVRGPPSRRAARLARVRRGGAQGMRAWTWATPTSCSSRSRPQPDLRCVGPVIDGSVAGGANVEVVRSSSPASDAERLSRSRSGSAGSGSPGSCGTGACAAAAAARSWGLGGAVVEVRVERGSAPGEARPGHRHAVRDLRGSSAEITVERW